MVIHIATIPQRIEDTQVVSAYASDGQNVTPGIVGVTDHCVTAFGYNRNYVALQIGGVVMVVKVTTVNCVAYLLCDSKEAILSVSK